MFAHFFSFAFIIYSYQFFVDVVSLNRMCQCVADSNGIYALSHRAAFRSTHATTRQLHECVRVHIVHDQTIERKKNEQKKQWIKFCPICILCVFGIAANKCSVVRFWAVWSGSFVCAWITVCWFVCCFSLGPSAASVAPLSFPFSFRFRFVFLHFDLLIQQSFKPVAYTDTCTPRMIRWRWCWCIWRSALRIFKHKSTPHIFLLLCGVTFISSSFQSFSRHICACVVRVMCPSVYVKNTHSTAFHIN